MWVDCTDSMLPLVAHCMSQPLGAIDRDKTIRKQQKTIKNMIIWTRWGILAVIIPFGIAVLCQLVFGQTPIFAGIGYLLSALPVWLIGKKWNLSDDGKDKHTLFWIHLEYWGILAGLVGLMVVVSETIMPLETDTYFIIFGLMLIPILIYQYSKSKSTFKDILYKLAPIRIMEPDNLPNKKISKIKEHSAFNAKEEVKNKESLDSKNRMSESRRAIEEFKKTKGIVRKFEPSDHSRFIPSSSMSTNISSTDVISNQSVENEINDDNN